MTGVEIPDSVQGTSLVPVLEDPKATVKKGALSFASGQSLRTSDWAYMQYKDGEELYDMNADPKQFTNLVGSADYEKKLKEMRAAMAKRLKKAGIETAEGKNGKKK